MASDEMGANGRLSKMSTSARPRLGFTGKLGKVANDRGELNWPPANPATVIADPAVLACSWRAARLAPNSVATMLPTTKVVLRMVAPRCGVLGLVGADGWHSAGFTGDVFVIAGFVVFMVPVVFRLGCVP